MGIKQEWFISNLGLVEYKNAYQLQTNLIEARHAGVFDKDIVLLLEHPPVFTMGLRGGRENLIIGEQELQNRGIDMVPVERGGDITFHGPGQLVCYLLVNLRRSGFDIPGFVRNIEEVMIRAANDENVHAVRDRKNPGVWTEEDKLGSIGVAVRHQITFHGFALNVNMDLIPFQWVHPCGLKNVAMTSLAAVKNADVRMASVQKSVIKHLEAVFNVRLKPVDREYLDRIAEN